MSLAGLASQRALTPLESLPVWCDILIRLREPPPLMVNSKAPKELSLVVVGVCSVGKWKAKVVFLAASLLEGVGGLSALTPSQACANAAYNLNR